VPGSLLRSLFSCNHARTEVHEGKCYCPDCGAGLIYRWVVLRCGECRTRRESRYRFRQVIPSQRCCTFCGSVTVLEEFLEDPAYFQLREARLMVFVEEAAMPSFKSCLSYLLGDTLSCFVAESIHTACAWLENSIAQPSSKPRFALLPVSHKAG
jgi:hypothetical protein